MSSDFSYFRYHTDRFLLADQVLHVVFLFLPVFWVFGVLAPVDTFLMYVLEQCHVFLFGGSYMASDIRYAVPLIKHFIFIKP